MSILAISGVIVRFICVRVTPVVAPSVEAPHLQWQTCRPKRSKHIILAENLTKVYQRAASQVPAVRGISLAVEPGEFVAIVGPSGSGKSTLFYLLGGLTRATEGRVVIDGVDFAALNDAERTKLRKHRIGFVFQKFNLLPTLSAMGNIEIAYEVSGRKGARWTGSILTT